jgi:hypothetical protein
MYVKTLPDVEPAVHIWAPAGTLISVGAAVVRTGRPVVTVKDVLGATEINAFAVVAHTAYTPKASAVEQLFAVDAAMVVPTPTIFKAV